MPTSAPSVTVENVNGHKSILTQLTIIPGASNTMRNIKSHSTEDAALLAALHEGQLVECRLFSLNNIMYYVTNDSIERGAERLRGDKNTLFRGEYWENRIQALKARFGDKQLSMGIDYRYIQESFVDIDERLKALDDTGYFHQP